MDEITKDKVRENMYKLVSQREFASFIIQRIKEIHGEEFVNECLNNTAQQSRLKNNKGDQVRERYQIVKLENPNLQENEIRKILSQEFRIKDKAVQHHLYKKI